MVEGNTWARAVKFNLAPKKHLMYHNAYPFFKKLGDLVVTGPTLTNVMDVRFVLIK